MIRVCVGVYGRVYSWWFQWHYPVALAEDIFILERSSFGRLSLCRFFFTSVVTLHWIKIISTNNIVVRYKEKQNVSRTSPIRLNQLEVAERKHIFSKMVARPNSETKEHWSPQCEPSSKHLPPSRTPVFLIGFLHFLQKFGYLKSFFIVCIVHVILVCPWNPKTSL